MHDYQTFKSGVSINEPYVLNVNTEYVLNDEMLSTIFI